MKNKFSLKYNLTCLLTLILGLNMVSCVDNNESDPPIPEFIPGQFISIAEVKALYDGELAKDYKQRVPVAIVENISIKGIVSANDKGDRNLYKEAYVEDATGGLLVKFNAQGAVNLGDSIIINLNGLYLGDYGDMIQLGFTPYTDDSGNRRVDGMNVTNFCYRYKYEQATTPTVKTIAELAANYKEYAGRLIRLENVQFATSELGKKFSTKDAENPSATNRTLEDCNKKTIIVRTSDFCAFSDSIVPNGSGSMIGVFTIFKSGTKLTPQFIIRSYDEIKMDNPRCGEGGGTTDPGTIVFEETFATGVGNFKAFSVKGDQVWQHDATYKYMKVSGNFNKVNYENEDWLVSPAINLSGVNNASLQFDHAGKVFGAPFTDMTVWVSTNFNGTDVAAASWTQVTIPTYMTGLDWNFVNSSAISLAGFNNQPSVFVAFKYTSSATLSGTWEIKNVKITK